MEAHFPVINNWPLAAQARLEFCKIDLTANNILAQRKMGGLVSAWGELSDLR